MPNAPSPKTEQVLLHGTTLRRAQLIVAAGKFSPHESLYVVFQSNRDLAEVFACRKAARERDQPRIVKIVVEDSDFQSLRKRGKAKLIPFDAGDDPYLRSRNQWVILPSGVQSLNHRLLSLESQ
jgi:hypothetical protein